MLLPDARARVWVQAVGFRGIPTPFLPCSTVVVPLGACMHGRMGDTVPHAGQRKPQACFRIHSLSADADLRMQCPVHIRALAPDSVALKRFPPSHPLRHVVAPKDLLFAAAVDP